MTLKGAQAKQNDAVPQGAGLAPKRDPEQRTGYEAEGSPMHRSHSFASRPAGVRPNRSRYSSGKRSVEGRLRAPSLASQTAWNQHSGAYSETSWAVQPKWQPDGTSNDLGFGLVL